MTNGLKKNAKNWRAISILMRTNENKIMTKQELIKALKKLHHGGDVEALHGSADDLLIEYIADADIKSAYDAVFKWYA